MPARAGSLKSFAEFYRPGTARNARGATTSSHTLIGSGWIGIGLPSRRLANYGAGELPAGTMEIAGHEGSPLAARDVVKITAGPEAGTTWRIGPPHRPGTGELLATALPYNEPLEVV